VKKFNTQPEAVWLNFIKKVEEIASQILGNELKWKYNI
jgi:hypothetical protein